MPRSQVPMPGRVLVVVMLLGLSCLGQVIGLASGEAQTASPFVFVLSVVFVVFLARGRPLARQWARFCAFLLAFAALGLFAALADSPDDVMMYTAWAFVVIAIAIFWGLGGKRAKRFFDLYCVHCGSYRTKPKSLLFNRVACKDCDREWLVHTTRVDDKVFE